MGREQRAIGGVGEVGDVGVLLRLVSRRPEQPFAAVGLDGEGIVVLVVILQQGIAAGQGRHTDMTSLFNGCHFHIGQECAGGAVVDLQDVVRRQDGDIAGVIVPVAPLDSDLFAAGEVDEGVGVIRVIAAEEGDTAGRVVHHAPVEAAQFHGLVAVQVVEDGVAVLTALEAGDADAAGRGGAVVLAGEQLAGEDVVKPFPGDAPVCAAKPAQGQPVGEAAAIRRKALGRAAVLPQQHIALPVGDEDVLMQGLVGVVVGVGEALGQVVAVEDEALAALIHHETVKSRFRHGQLSPGGEVVHPDAAGGTALESPDVGVVPQDEQPAREGGVHGMGKGHDGSAVGVVEGGGALLGAGGGVGDKIVVRLAGEGVPHQLDTVGAAALIEHFPAPEDGAAAVAGVGINEMERIVGEPRFAVILRCLRCRRPLGPGRRRGQQRTARQQPACQHKAGGAAAESKQSGLHRNTSQFPRI